jgi:hypothetical protein
MKLIQIDNTLYIVEGENKYKVSDKSEKELKTLAFQLYVKQGGYGYNTIFELESIGVNISEVKHRIEIREGTIDLGPMEGKYGDGEFEAVLSPEKEDKCDGTCAPNECICDELPEGFIQTYSIEQIEKAFAPINEIIGDGVMKQLFNNLTK